MTPPFLLTSLILACVASSLNAAGPGAASMPTSRTSFRILSTHPTSQPAWPAGVERIEYASGVDEKADWATALPPGQTTDWVIFIHGHGSTGDQLYTRADLRQNWLPLFQQRRMGILTVNLRGNAWMSPAAAQDLHELLAWARPHYHMKRLVFVSGSMGGTSNLIYAVLHPADVNAVLALCPATDLSAYLQWCREQAGPPVLAQIARAIEDSYGGLPRKVPAYEEHNVLAHTERLKMPIYVAHGSADAIIPVSQSRRLAEHLNGQASFRYEEIPGGNHDAPLRNAREGLNWVLQQRHP